MKRLTLTLLALTLIVMSVAAQRPIRLSVHPQVAPDSADIAYYGKEHAARAVAMVAGFNLGVWAFDRFALNADYAHISLKSIADNLQHGFVWDNDQLGTNMFMHPYHGGLYFNCARSNGFNFWQSTLFALGGSAMWELFLENEYPSTNDIICTPVGGAAVGEITYRASDMVLRDNAVGWERAGREIAGFLIAPTRGLTRLLNGNMWRHRATSGSRFGIPNIAFELSAGVRTINIADRFFDSGTGMAFQLNLEYGDRFEIGSHKLPYDYFTINAELNAHRSQPFLGQFNITGRLLAKEFLEEKEQVLTVGMYQHFDYYDSDTISDVSRVTPYKLGVPASVGAGVYYRDLQTRLVAFDAYLHANAILMGGVLSDYYRVDMRNYNLASGFSLKGGVNFVLRGRKLSLGLDYGYFRMFTWKGYPSDVDWDKINPHDFNIQGDKSVATFGVGSARVDVHLWRHLYATAQFSHYYRSTRYRDFPHVRTNTMALRLLLTYKF